MRQPLGHLRRRLTGIAGFVAIVGAALVGCGKDAAPGEKLIPVAGTVTLNGQPLTTGGVTFHADVAKGNNTQHLPAGVLDAAGKYKLLTAAREGAPPGWYKVAVSAQAPADAKNPYAPPRHLIHPKFGDPKTSGLTVQVVENPASGAYDFTVTK
jgi:hypothetical protein